MTRTASVPERWGFVGGRPRISVAKRPFPDHRPSFALRAPGTREPRGRRGWKRLSGSDGRRRPPSEAVSARPAQKRKDRRGLLRAPLDQGHQSPPECTHRLFTMAWWPTRWLRSLTSQSPSPHRRSIGKPVEGTPYPSERHGHHRGRNHSFSSMDVPVVAIANPASEWDVCSPEGLRNRVRVEVGTGRRPERPRGAVRLSERPRQRRKRAPRAGRSCLCRAGAPATQGFSLVGPRGIEPRTHGLKVRCSAD